MRNGIKKVFDFLFGFSSGEAGAFTVLMPLLGLILYSEPIWNHFHPLPSPDIEVEILDSLLEIQPQPQLFPFDPNLASETAFDSLGLKRDISGRLIRYRSAGGRFRKPADLLKLHGMDTAEFRRLEPWVRIYGNSSEIRPMKTPGKSTGQRSGQVRKTPRTYDLNLADTADFEAWPGIGYKTAARIIRYRNALGGFIHRDQLYEVWAIDSITVFSMVKFHITPAFQPKRINLNMATEDDLEQHPYLSRPQARAILFYRYQHGDFKSVDDLQKIKQLDESVFQKIQPYLSVK